MLRPAQIKPEVFESRRKSFLPGADALQDYVSASTFCWLHRLNSTQTPSKVYDIRPPWSKVPESVGGGGGRGARGGGGGADSVGGQMRGDKERALLQCCSGEPDWPSGKALGW